MKVIILAGGKGTRLPDSAKNIPKSLVEVAGKPIIQHQIDSLKKHGLIDLRFSLGYMADKIIDYLDGKYEYVIEPKPLGTGGAIKFAAKNLKDDFLALNGDILCDLNFAKFISTRQSVPHKTLGSIVVRYVENARDFGLIKTEQDHITEFLEKPETNQSGYINAGIYMLSPLIFKNVSRETFSIEHDVFPDLAKNGQLSAFIYNGFWTDLGTEERLKQAKSEVFHVKQ